MTTVVKESTAIEQIETAKLTLEQALERVDEIKNVDSSVEGLQAARAILYDAMVNIPDDVAIKFKIQIASLERESIDRIIGKKDLRKLIKTERRSIKTFLRTFENVLNISNEEDEEIIDAQVITESTTTEAKDTNSPKESSKPKKDKDNNKKRVVPPPLPKKDKEPDTKKQTEPKKPATKVEVKKTFDLEKAWKVVRDYPKFNELVEIIRVLKKDFNRAKRANLLDQYDEMARKYLGIQSIGRAAARREIINYLKNSNCAYMLKAFPGDNHQRKTFLKEILLATNSDETTAKKTITDELANLKEHIRLAKSGKKSPKADAEEAKGKDVEPPKPKPIEYPSSISSGIKGAVDQILKDDKQKRLFILAWRINESELETVSKETKRVIRNQIEALKKVAAVPTKNGFRETSEKIAIFKATLQNAMQVFAEELDENAGEKLDKAIEAKSLMDVLLVVAYRHDDLKEKIKNLFAILNIHPSRYTDPERRAYFVALQQEIQTILFNEVPTELVRGIKKGTSNKEKITQIQSLGLREKKKKIEALRAKLSELDDELEDFQNIEEERATTTTDQTSDSRENFSSTAVPPTTPETETTTASDTSTEAEDDEKTTTTPESNGGTNTSASESSDNNQTDTPEETKTSEKAPEKENIDSRIQTMMNAVLTDRTMYRTDKKDADPASLAIKFLIRRELGLEGYRPKKKLDLAALKDFLQKPGISVDVETEELNAKNNLDQLKAKLTEEERNYKKLEDEIKTLRGRMNVRGVTEEEREKLEKKINEELYPALHSSDDHRNRIKTAINLKNGTMRYNSTSQVLAMIRLFVSDKNNEHLSQVDVLNDVDKLIEAQKENMSGKLGKGLMGILSLGGLLKPSLKATLQALEKDPQLAKVGAVKLAELSEAHKSKGAVDNWIATIEGTEDYKMTKVIPRLIAYLETALRNGNISHINPIYKNKIKKLLEYFKEARHKYITDKVDKITTGKGMSDVDIMSIYFKELDKLTVDQNNIEKSIITRHSKGKIAKKLIAGAGIGALGAGGVFAGVALGPLTAGLLGISGATGYLAKSYGTKDKKEQDKYRKSALRIGWTGALATGAMLVNPLLAPVALAGVFSPGLGKLFKFAHGKRKGIGRVAGTTAKGGLKAMKWGAPKAAGIPEVGARALIGASTAFIGPWLYKKITGRSFYAPRFSMALNNALNKKKK